MNPDQLLRVEISAAINALFNQQIDTLQIQPTNQEFEGSHTLVCFPLTKLTRKGPEETARMVGDQLLKQSKLVVKYNVVKGFLNLVLSDKIWVELLGKIYDHPDYGQIAANGQEIMIEYSSPNTNKPLHLGHLRNNFLGWSVSEIYKANGYKVHKVQIINDRGIHICKSMAAWGMFGDGETPASSGMKGDHLVGKYYVAFDKAHRAQLANSLEKIHGKNEFDFLSEGDAARVKALVENIRNVTATVSDTAAAEKKVEALKEQIKDIAEQNTPMMKAAQELLRKWEQKDPDTVALWKKMNGWVYEGFDETYKKMGVDFDKLYYESDTYLIGKDKVLKGLEKGVFFRKDDGSVWVDLTADGLDQKVLLRSDGTSVYMTQDIGTAILRFNDFPNITGQVYTVGNEQEYHFKVLFLILSKLGYDWAKRCYHLSYGMVDLPSGKMKSREGTVVDADDLMAEMESEAEKQTREKQEKELGKLDDMSGAEARHLFHILGMGALKFFLLKVDPKKRMLFDPNESIQLQGFTGPFIQYTHARIRAIIRRAESLGITVNSDAFSGISELAPAEREGVQVLNAFEAKIEEAAREFSPAVIANYAYELAKVYNQFYQSISIFNECDKQKLAFRIAFSAAVARAIKKSMGLLGIEVPERM
jgi:arginyl-tRNA synthetase